jgi:hypothetical protein
MASITCADDGVEPWVMEIVALLEGVIARRKICTGIIFGPFSPVTLKTRGLAVGTTS